MLRPRSGRPRAEFQTRRRRKGRRGERAKPPPVVLRGPQHVSLGLSRLCSWDSPNREKGSYSSL